MKEWLYVESPEELSGTLLPLSLEPGAPEVIPEWTPACVLLLSWATTDYGGAGVRGWSPQQKPLWRGLISARATCQVGWDGTGSWGITEVGCMVLARLMESDRYSACQHQASWVIVFSNTTKKKKKNGVFQHLYPQRKFRQVQDCISAPLSVSVWPFLYDLSHRKSVQFAFGSVSEILVLCIAVVLLCPREEVSP